MNDHDTPPAAYPAGTVRALIDTELVTEPTRRALQARLSEPKVAVPRVLDAASFATLQAVCARLIVQPASRPAIDIAGAIDSQLAGSPGDGWRYDVLPPDLEAHRLGLDGIERLAQRWHGVAFGALDAGRQDAMLRAVQSGEVDGAPWDRLPAGRWFEELLAAATIACYAHPLAHEDIGYVGMADAQGWQAIGLGALDAHEPRQATNPHVAWLLPQRAVKTTDGRAPLT